MSLTRFFADYAARSHSDEPERLADMYAETFIVGGPRGTQAFTNDSRFREWLRHVRSANQQHGLRAVEVVALREVSLSARHTLATVTWSARFVKTGERRIDFEISYLLEQTEASWKILSYISQRDEEEEQQRLGLL
jgi:hypothetical protein